MAVWALARKDLLLLRRDRAGLFFTLAFPFLVAIFFGAVFSGGSDGPRNLPIYVVDEDQSEGSRSFIDQLMGSEALGVEVVDRATAQDGVRRGRRVAYVALQPGFGESLAKPFQGNPPVVQLGVDPARAAEAGLLQGLLTQFAAERLQDVFSDASSMSNSAQSGLASLESSGASGPQADSLRQLLTQLDSFASVIGSEDSSVATDGDISASPSSDSGFKLEPIRIEEAAIAVERSGPPSAYAISFPQGILWGLIGCTASFALLLVTERSTGTLVRLQSAPIGRVQVLLGKALACFISCVVVSCLLLVFGTLVFGLAPESWLKVGAAVGAMAFGFSGLMMLLATLGRTERAVSGIAWAVLMVFAMLGGGMVPLFVMPSWMRTLSNVSPVKWSILGLEGALWRGFSWAELAIPCAILLAVGLIGLLLGAKLFRWSEA